MTPQPVEHPVSRVPWIPTEWPHVSRAPVPRLATPAITIVRAAASASRTPTPRAVAPRARPVRPSRVEPRPARQELAVEPVQAHSSCATVPVSTPIWLARINARPARTTAVASAPRTPARIPAGHCAPPALHPPDPPEPPAPQVRATLPVAPDTTVVALPVPRTTMHRLAAPNVPFVPPIPTARRSARAAPALFAAVAVTTTAETSASATVP